MIRSMNTLVCVLLGILIVLWQNDIREVLLLALLVPWDKVGRWADEMFEEVAEMRRARKLAKQDEADVKALAHAEENTRAY